ncbi:MAG TPA: hypothetical protein DDZ80_30935 [Cyanobacteria bacterium UBA8803]|nr:hypothetical protein [Cyanobacteria bacterium UBA9273]HBL62637.1 hypothetical protein [Cyanobacteria bacterium UBA8803]
MNLPATPDLSLYQLTLDHLAISHSLRVSSVTLKSLVQSILEVLIEEKIPATILVKLPTGEGWQEELKRYQQQASVPPKIYLCSSFADELVNVNEPVEQLAAPEGNSYIFPLQLAAGSQLQREYFFLVLSEKLSNLIVTYPLPSTVPLEATAKQLIESWLAVCTFDRQVVERVLEEIKRAIAVADTIPDELLGNGEVSSSELSDSDEKTLLTRVLLKQLQHAGENWHSSSALSLHHELHYKDELLKRVAQELRTPLTNMKTALSLLDSPQLKPAQRQRYMQLLNTECDRQNSLIAGLLELVQIDEDPQALTIPSVEVENIIPGVVSTYQPLAQEKGIQLGYTVPAELPSVSCLETWLRQIAINLLHNSLKFTSTGGQVRVLASLQGEYVQLAFSDTGIGIAPSEIPKIFDSFYRGRPTPGEDMGAGLGLTIVQQLLLRCGGSISVTSKLGKGSNFKVLLPIAYPLRKDEG